MTTVQRDKALNILIADDDPDDRLLIKDALDECGIRSTVSFVRNGQELLDYLGNCKDDPGAEASGPCPVLIMLDLNMPIKDGREALKEIKSNPSYCRIPILVLTTSSDRDSIVECYALGANSYIVNPRNFMLLVDAMDVVCQYWHSIVQLPPAHEAH
jgi:CheY-like chemotaxis protein